MAQSTINVAFVSESARVDLNAAPKNMLEGLFAAVGVNPAQAASFADRIIGWRKKANPAGQNGEIEAYKQAGLDYPPRQAPFQNALELPLVLGLPPYIVERILPLVTVYNGIGRNRRPRCTAGGAVRAARRDAGSAAKGPRRTPAEARSTARRC